MTPSPTGVPHTTIGVKKGMAIHAVPEGQLHNAIAPANPEGGVGGDPRALAAQLRAAGSDDDLCDASRRVGNAGRRLWEESLVMVIVPAEYEIHTSGG